MLTQNTRGAPGSDSRLGSLPGEKPKRSSVQACRETQAAAGAFWALPVAIGVELLPQRLGLRPHALDLLLGQAALPRPDARPAVAAERAVVRRLGRVRGVGCAFDGGPGFRAVRQAQPFVHVAEPVHRVARD